MLMQTNYNYLQAEDKVIDQATYVRCGSIATKIDCSSDFRLSPKNGSTADISVGPVRANMRHPTLGLK